MNHWKLVKYKTTNVYMTVRVIINRQKQHAARNKRQGDQYF